VSEGAVADCDGPMDDVARLSGAELIRARLTEHARALRDLVDQAEVIARIAGAVIDALGSAHKVIVFGNGGSAADAQHLAGELVGRYRADRAALPAIALTADSAVITAIANDHGYAEIFARQVEALGRAGDVAVGITTSGRSENVLRGLKAAHSASLTTVALTGRAGLALGDADIELRIASDSPPRIQEAHMAAIHCICELVERHWVP
jgi:D-sedoheptulose 7-phosphate isomerase